MNSWVRALRGTASHGAELDWLGADGDRVRRELGEGALSWALETGERLAREVTDAVPIQGEGAHFMALRRATTSTALRALLLVVDPKIRLVGPETEEIARDFARRGVSLEDLLRGIRHGYSSLAAILLDAVEQGVADEGGAEMKRVALLLFAQIESFIDVASAEYQQEKADYDATVAAARLDAVQRILGPGGEAADPQVLSQVLGYPINAACHLAVVVWTVKPDYAISLRRTVDRVFQEFGAVGPTLTLPVGSQVLWSWIALQQPPKQWSIPANALPDGCRVAVGQVSGGVAGFRRSYRQARSVEVLVRRREPDIQVLTHAEVELPALLTADITAAQDLVERMLGPLADSSPRMAELRRTLLCYLDFERSISRVASELFISRNTVTYRVQQGMRLCGYQQGSSPLPLHVALALADWLD